MSHHLLGLAALLMGMACDPPPEAAAPTAPAAEPAQDLRERHGKLFKELRALVDELKAAGRYDCCIETPCSHCAMMAGGCSCGEGLRRGEPVCEECALMWVRGLGAETGVDPATVRSFLEAERIINAKAAKSAGKHKAHPSGPKKHEASHRPH
jgi:hypothetical protein